jgi:transposase-like protein
MTEVRVADQGDVVVIRVEALRAGPEFREGGITEAHVLSLAELEGRWPPILVTADHLVIDGRHRLAAAQRLGLTELPARVFEGSPDEAFVEFVRCNVGHGLPLSLSERRRAVGHILGAHPEWSDRRVARLCALSPTTVGKLRSELAQAELAQSELAQSELPAGCPDAQSGHPESRVGLNGRLRSVNPEGVRARVVEALSARPQSSLRAVAQEVGVSPETVRTVRKSLQAPAAGDGSRNGARRRGPDPSETPLPSETPIPDIAWLADLVGRGRLATATEPWREDRALSSLACGEGFLSWFDGSAVDEAECWRFLPEVPLSRVYMVADEARRRATCWASFASALEDRVSKRAATS